jgi:pectate lyase
MARGITIILACSLLGLTQALYAQVPAFPGAEGFGAAAVGGRNGDVYIVNSLADTNTLGTLRHAISSAPVAGRTIVFNTSGTITLGSNLEVNKNNITIAGQTAPGPGITLKGKTLRVLGSNNIVRNLHVRLGQAGGANDAMAVEGGSNNIVDHVSGSWSGDEVISVADTATSTTVQWSFMHEALNNENHSFGSLIRPDNNAKVSLHHNYYAHNRSRNPRVGTYNGSLLEIEFRNNVVYNWIDEVGYSGGSGEFVDLNFINNYAVAGLTTGSKVNRLFSSGSTDTSIYQSGNYSDGNKDADRDGVLATYASPYFVGAATVEASPFNYSGLAYPVTTTSAPDAYDDVMDYAGAFFWNRDAIDARVIGHLDNSVALAGVIINSENDVGGFLSVPVIERDDDWDSDDDGMPDYWENLHGLNPNSAADRTGDFDTDGYNNLEEYLNDAGAFPAPVAIVFNGSTNSRYAQITNWGPVWQPSRFDTAEINSGTVVVDAVGQHAGTLKIGANAGNTATLNISGGWLKIEDELSIGDHASATGTVNLSGGELYVDTISKGAGDTFNFTGGTLHAGTVGFDLVNNGGTLSPGSSVGETHVMGNLDLASGALQIELESALLADFVLVDGTATLGGNLVVEFLDDYAPTSGSWLIMTADSFEDDFASITAGFSVVQQGNDLFLQLGAPTLEGDYNGDGKVSAADYTVWRDTLGSTTDLRANGDDSNSVIDGNDYQVWLDNYGNTQEGSGNGASINSAAVPEPGTWLLALVGSAVFFAHRIRRWRY